MKRGDVRGGDEVSTVETSQAGGKIEHTHPYFTFSIGIDGENTHNYYFFFSIGLLDYFFSFLVSFQLLCCRENGASCDGWGFLGARR